MFMNNAICKTLTYEELESRDFRSSLKIEAFGKIISFSDGEPEDANLSRDFSGCFQIFDMLKLAYEAWKKWEEWNFENQEVDNI